MSGIEQGESSTIQTWHHDRQTKNFDAVDSFIFPLQLGVISNKNVKGFRFIMLGHLSYQAIFCCSLGKTNQNWSDRCLYVKYFADFCSWC